MGNVGFTALRDSLEIHRSVVVQTHNYPDHDAVASAFGLHALLSEAGYRCSMCYGGDLQSNSLRETLSAFDVPISRCETMSIPQDAQIVLVDGFMGNKNVIGLPGEEVAVIDHHAPPEQPRCKYADIREDYGSCSTIIYEYFRQSTVELAPRIATAFMMGIMMDTGFLTRGVSQHDLSAFTELYFVGDWQRGSYLLNNSLSVRNLPIFREALEASRFMSDCCFVLLKRESSSEIMGILADFLLRLQEIHFVVIANTLPEEHRLSVRSEDPDRPASLIVRRALDGIGSGGGHIHMGGGVIPADAFPGENELWSLFLRAMEDVR